MRQTPPSLLRLPRRYEMSALERIGRGLTAGAAGTAAMTAWQEISSRLDSSGDERRGEEPRSEHERWEDAPAPAKLAKRLLDALGVAVSADRIPLLTNVLHWGYGTGWGAVYSLLRAMLGRRRLVAEGAVFGTGVWAMSYAQLVPLGLYEPPWRYPAKSVAKDLSYHLVYGVGTSAAYQTIGRAMERRRRRRFWIL